ncbi:MULTISPECIES: tRNA (adenosine(37)-N6)-threonylcarbamoyltransferase complex dimerization subunit type 1 TsaB [Anaerotruncus]|uniref:tRNA (adenosine(37)-N6)-threonylcarbamoyltransferase complex dimerization subunit type 1 TsaB n=2 Tax=Oscillospiraceae TaxID=216572 RepID=UPI000E4C45D4|nr:MULTISPECIES: tRNA (adenosine(37)-N6)-threonylcarbamoyltransferase complex dimerization subunit type 1 TsaB [Anaerotruncus]RGX56088.1 tRNA (adenosine(37)-N6)-threonylcarbamoyltransferase complex dimerization subunit type 1 TsaB [Anaerotruncus sp. AF02-27]
MKILALDTSSQSASCAILEDDKLLGEFYGNVNLTHSQTIMPMVESLLTQTRVALSEIGLFAVTEGPGSFTGLRIGLSAVKGMAHALEKPCAGVSTLEALAWNLCGPDCVVAPVLDARCSQVYTALFRWKDGVLIRLAPDEAITIKELSTRLKNLGTCVLLVGDGAKMCYTILKDELPGLGLVSPAARFTRAASVALAAQRIAARGGTVAPDALAPAYLRLPQAERELLAKQKNA